ETADALLAFRRLWRKPYRGQHLQIVGSPGASQVLYLDWNHERFTVWHRRASAEQQRMPIAIPRQSLAVESSVVRRTGCRRRQLRFMPDQPVAETRHIFSAQTMVRINHHAQQPV